MECFQNSKGLARGLMVAPSPMSVSTVVDFMGDNPASTVMRGAIDSVRTQPGGRGGQAIVINFITVHSILGKEGVKKAKKLRACSINGPLESDKEYQIY